MSGSVNTDLDGGPRLRWFLALTQFLMILDTSILNVAVPVIGADLAMTPAAETWVLNAYVVAFGGLLLLSGWVADALGHGRILVAGLILLALGAAFGAVAGSGEAIIVSRAVQGVGAAMAAAAAMALVFSRYAGAARRKTLGLFASMAGLGGAAGTALSGVLTEYLGWRSTFWLNVAAALVLVVWACTVRGIFAPGAKRQPNILGGGLITIALAAAAYAITSLSGAGGGLPVATVLVAVVSFAAFVATERRVRNPLINPQVWRIPPLLRALGLAGTGQWVLVPVFLFISLYLQRVLGYDPLVTGLALLPMSVAICFIAPLVPRVIVRWGVYQVMAGAFLLVAVAGVWLSRISPDGSFAIDVLGPTLLLAVGLPTISVTTNVVTAEHSPPEDPGIASGLLTTAQQFGATLGLAAWVAIASTSDLTGAAGLTEGYANSFLVAAGVMLVAALVSLSGLRRTRTHQPKSDRKVAGVSP